MKMHSNILTESAIREALERAKERGNVDRDVHFMILEPRGSRQRANGFEIRLEWLGTKTKGDGRRWTNSGNGGANSEHNGNGTYAATYDEWGWFIAELFNKDEELIFGHYKGWDSFLTQTRYAFEV